MQHPTVKSERLDPAFLPPSYHQQQQLLLQQQQKQQQLRQAQQQQAMSPQANSVQTGVPIANQTTKHVAHDSDIESQPDFPSIKGVFGWTVIDSVNIPYILRSDKQFVSVRIVEMKLLSRYPNSYPDDLGKHAPLTSFFVTPNEAKLLNEINMKHCEGEYGKKEFGTKELIVQLSDFLKFYELVKKTFPDAASVKAAQIAAEGAGWLQIKNTVTPYIRRTDGDKYVPLSVIQYAAGLLTNVKNGVQPTPTECQMLNEACKKAGVEFVFSDTTTRLINLTHMLKAVRVDVIELPSSNPLKHATYMELPTSAGVSLPDKPKAKDDRPINKHPTHSQTYMFQPNTLDKVKTQLQGSSNRPDVPRLQMQNTNRHQMSVNQMFDPRMMSDPRYAEAYRMQIMSQNRHALSNGPPNININQSNNLALMNHMSPIMQYYMGMQRPVASDPQRLIGPLSNINGTDQGSRRSPGTNSNQPRSRPPSQTRPPSGPSVSRPPSASPLSPTSSQHSPIGQPPPYSSLFDTSRTPHVNGPLALQQLQSMQRFLNSNDATFSNRLGNNVQATQMSSDKGLSTVHSDMPTNKTNRNANMEIPDLFSPTGSNISPIHNSQPGPSNPKTVESVPPPLILMSGVPNTPVASVVNGGDNSESTLITSSRENELLRPSIQEVVEQPRPQTLTVVNQSREPLVNCIKGAWLNNKSISCLFVEDDDRKGQYCLVEAVCKLYFNGCSVNEFLFALENVLSVPLLVCNDEEEKAFIQYYSLPVIELKCNKMIRFEDLEKYFPQLTYMFPSKEAIDQSENGFKQSVRQDDENNLANGDLGENDVVDTSSAMVPMNAKRLLSESDSETRIGTIEGPQTKVARHTTGGYFLY